MTKRYEENFDEVDDFKMKNKSHLLNEVSKKLSLKNTK